MCEAHRICGHFSLDHYYFYFCAVLYISLNWSQTMENCWIENCYRAFWTWISGWSSCPEQSWAPVKCMGSDSGGRKIKCSKLLMRWAAQILENWPINTWNTYKPTFFGIFSLFSSLVHSHALARPPHLWVCCLPTRLVHLMDQVQLGWSNLLFPGWSSAKTGTWHTNHQSPHRCDCICIFCVCICGRTLEMPPPHRSSPQGAKRNHFPSKGGCCSSRLPAPREMGFAS